MRCYLGKSTLNWYLIFTTFIYKTKELFVLTFSNAITFNDNELRFSDFSQTKLKTYMYSVHTLDTYTFS